VPVLPEWKPTPLGVFAVTPPGERVPPKVRYAIAALRSFLQARPALSPVADAAVRPRGRRRRS
jgi:hypothetical protein